MSADDTVPWSTSRCNRLLRPLSSKLAKLRKELERPRTTSATESRNVSSAFATKGSPQKTTNFTRPANKPRGFEKARDPDWRPGAKPGAVKKTTYGGRGRGRPAGLQRSASDTGTAASRPGEVAFTPLISRMGGQLPSSPQVPISPLRKYAKNRGPLLAPMNATHMAEDLRKLIHGLSEAYANLLQATSIGENRWKGTRSLMSACLRRMPAYIELEEHFAKLDRLEDEAEEEDRDVTHEIYEHLEARFEQEHGLGWRPFKQVVRAHGTALICDAITDEVIGLKNALMLVTHCVNGAAWDEAERLLLAYAPLLESLSIPINIRASLFDEQKSPFLSAVKAFVDQTGRHRLLYDLLEHMVALELLPLEWLATDSMRPVWDRLVRTISENDHRTLASATRFFGTVTIASMGLPDSRLLEDEVTGSISRRFVPSSREELRQALDTTFSSLLTVLCSIALVNRSRDDPVGQEIAGRVTSVLDTVVIAISNREDIQDELRLLNADTDDVQVMAQRGLWVTFASCLVHLEGGNNNDSVTTSLEASTSVNLIDWIATQYSSKNFASLLASLPAFISSIARGTGRIWKDDGFIQLQRLITPLMTMSGCRLPHKLWTLKRLALESAMEFAHGTGDSEHMAYAGEIEKKMRTHGRLVIMHSPQKNDSPTTSGGFRWEEGIGEWVTCTPFVRQDVKRQQRKPVRALGLLPTPIQSEDEKTDASEVEDGLPDEIPNTPAWEVTAFDYEDDEDTVPQSSPIKRAPRTSTSSLGKRTRASSPKVVIPVKRMHMTPPDSPVVKYYPELPEDKHGPRRSRRPRQETKVLTTRLRTQRSRTSLASGLRDLKRPTYAEVAIDDSDVETSEAETSSPSQDDLDTSYISVKSTRQSAAKRGRGARRSLRNQDPESEEEHDELSKTPARPRPQLRKRVSGHQAPRTRKAWWRAGGAGVVGDSEDDSADELSFH
jgi:hypothetical protein